MVRCRRTLAQLSRRTRAAARRAKGDGIATNDQLRAAHVELKSGGPSARLGYGVDSSRQNVLVV
jgi:hypothetical protein